MTKGVTMPVVSAGANHVGASEVCMPNVICPSGAASDRPGLSRASLAARFVTAVLIASSWTRSLEAKALEGSRVVVQGDPPQGRFLHTRADAVVEVERVDRQKQRALVREPLDPVQERLAL